jgi:two-component system, cell cycle sensor histidine kinase and response regulator CckA
MGDQITREEKTAELARARSLKDALERRDPAFSFTTDPALHRPAPEASHLADSAEVQAAYLEQLVECTPEAISILDEQYRIIRINGEFTRMFGYRPEEALGRRIDSLIVPPDRSSETRWIGELLSQGRKVRLETKRQRKDGAQLDVFLSGSPVLVGGEQAATYVLYRDISEQKRAETLNAALYRIAEKASSAEDLQQFYASIHAILGELMCARNIHIALYDPCTGLLSFPYFVDEHEPRRGPRKLGRGLTEYVLRSGEPLLCTAATFAALVQRGEVEAISQPSLDWLGVPLKASGKTFGALVVQSYSERFRYGEKDRDILMFVSQQLASAIEHKRHEEALRRSEARHRSLVQRAVYGIYRSNLDGKFLDVNPALITMLGYSAAEEVLNLDPKRDVFLDPEEQTRLMRQLRQDRALEHFEVRWKRQDGNSITVRLSGRIVSSPEESDEALEVIAEDVTERRVLEDQFRQAQKMEAVGRLAGGVAHDFNNLLMVISGYTEVLSDHTGLENPLYPKIAAIRQATDRATTLTRQLLAFSRKQILELKIVDMNAIVQDIERLLRPLIGENIELATGLAADLGRTRADAGQIEQVIMNLVVNAKDAMPDGGKITIQTANVNLGDDSRIQDSDTQPGPYVMLSISDTGHGMDKETQSRVFEPFFTTKEKGKGTGLGLSTVYGIIKQSEGYVFVQSEVGRGTSFHIYLPLVADAVETVGASQTPPPASGGAETVLLVEDEESVRQLVRETLEGKGYKVLESENGATALKIAAEHHGAIDLLITDVVMPGMNGNELAEQLCAAYPRTKVLYLSGYTEEHVVHTNASGAGSAFLQKPFTLQVLSRKVREVLRGTRA